MIHPAGIESMIKKGLLILVLFCTSFLYAQKLTTSDPFLNHLLYQELHENAIFYLESKLNDTAQYSLSTDSSHFILALLYQPSNLIKSTFHFESIKKENEVLSVERKRGLIVNYIEDDKLDSVRSIMNSPSMSLWLKACDSMYLESALQILQRKEERSLLNDCKGLEWDELKKVDSTLNKFGRKSPFLAGSMSALIPGLGKVYAGKPRQGVMAFVTSVVLGWQAVEGYQNGGVNDPRFIIFGSLFAIHYVGNIWGSAVAVSVNYQNNYYESKGAVLATVKLSLNKH